jgi:hypothetical protein
MGVMYITIIQTLTIIDGNMSSSLCVMPTMCIPLNNSPFTLLFLALHASTSIMQWHLVTAKYKRKEDLCTEVMMKSKRLIEGTEHVAGLISNLGSINISITSNKLIAVGTGEWQLALP